MRKLICVLIFALMLPSISYAERWAFDPDKKKHAIVGGVIGTTNWMMHVNVPERKYRVGVPLALSTIIATGKELTDDTFSLADIAYTLGGTGVTVGLGEMFLPKPVRVLVGGDQVIFSYRW